MIYSGHPGDTIAAISTPTGIGALGIIRISGADAIGIADGLFSKSISDAKGYSLHYGTLTWAGEAIDDAIVSVFRGSKSFTGEDSIEITAHGSPYILSKLMQVLIESGCRLAQPGEFSMRAFANGKMDLSQAEAIADLIASTSRAEHKLAINQMRGQFSREISTLRQKLIHFASLIELELDFGEEDVTFADRDDLKALVTEILGIVGGLAQSFARGNVLKNGIPVAILGAPNRGKSTLLNTLLREDRAIVSAIAGTTRDTIEDETVLDGVRFRFIDTAGLRDTTDEIEKMGIERAIDKARKALVVIYLVEADMAIEEINREVGEIKGRLSGDALWIIAANKCDQSSSERREKLESEGILPLSATEGTGIPALTARLLEASGAEAIASGDIVVTNLRHYEALRNTEKALTAALSALNTQVTGDFIAMDIRQALFHLGEITGAITTDDLLGNIFSKFCIGK